ncbi:MAG TPA: glycine zipper 2TM domain-containing protein [Burkholderiales bacterium]|nr:glycine zipper 2TM domain-containing protein [Burkholderiales bacterium]
MHARPGLVRTLALLTLVAGGLAATVPLNAYGDPPPWAPAHGKRKKGDPYTGFSGKKWDKHYGVLAGRCNREVIGEIIGAAAGGAIGAQVGNESNREIAIIVGSVAGAIIGANVGRGLDEIDRACIGHALELVGDKRSVTWASADNRRTYRFYPVRGFAQDGVKCREFDFRVTTTDGIKKTNRVKACPGSDGTWRFVG